jgi:divalent metal cation (Fe/Co/Zn/Cd) transporter
MDTRIPEQIEREIRMIIEDTPYPCAGYHKLRSRLAGSNKYVDFHLLICREARIDKAHELASGVENRIEGAIKPIDVVIHLEPCLDQCDLTEVTCTVRLRRNPGAAPQDRP